MVKCLPTVWETQVQFLGREDLLEKWMATHSSILAWKISWTEEPGRLQSMGSQRVWNDWVTSLSLTSEYKTHQNSPGLNYLQISYYMGTLASSFLKLRYNLHTIKFYLFYMYNSMIFSKFSKLCKHRHNPNLENFHHLQNILPAHWQFSIPLLTPGNYGSASCPYKLAFSGHFI